MSQANAGHSYKNKSVCNLFGSQKVNPPQKSKKEKKTLQSHPPTLQPYILKLFPDFIYFYFFSYICLSESMPMNHIHAVPMEDRKEYQIPWNRVSSTFKAPYGCSELNIGPLEERQCFSLHKISISPVPVWFCCCLLVFS